MYIQRHSEINWPLGIEFSLFYRFTDDAFDAEQAATIGVDFKVKTITINGDKVSGYRFSKFCPCFINIMKKEFCT